MHTIYPMQLPDISLLHGFPPQDWNLDLPRLLNFHFGQPYFHAVVAKIEKHIVGCGIALIHGNVCWLGTIIVLPEFRCQGIGYDITRHLKEYCAHIGCRTQLLIATELGEPVYRKLGFVEDGSYELYSIANAPSNNLYYSLREITADDYRSITEIDSYVTGENRFAFLKRYFIDGWVSYSDSNGKIDGFYLPNLGDGLVVSINHESGLNLLRFRLSKGKCSVVVPSGNVIVKEFLLSAGFHVAKTLPRMLYGRRLLWRQDKIFSRGSGYCG